MHFMDTLAKSRTLLACWLRGCLDVHRRRTEQERDFYRNLAAYCRANNLSPICEDDWKTAASSGPVTALPQGNSKGDVLWTTANLPR